MAASFLSGITVVAGVSIIAALLMLGGTGWVAGTQMVDLVEKLNNSGLPSPDPSRCTSSHHPTDKCTYNLLYYNLMSVWMKNKPILVTCSAIAIVVGFIQLTVSLLVMFSDSKSARKRTRIWLTTHFVLFFTLLVCLLSAFLTRLNHGLDMKSWSEIVENLETVLKKIEPHEDYSKLFMSLQTSSPLFYAVVTTDFVAVGLLFFVGICIMHKYNDYEPQE